MARVLFLGPHDSPVFTYLKSAETEVVQTMGRLDNAFVDAQRFDFLVSYGYRYMIQERLLSRFPIATQVPQIANI